MKGNKFSEGNMINRRDFIKKAARVGGLSAASIALGFWLHNRNKGKKGFAPQVEIHDYTVPDTGGYPGVAILHGENPGDLVEAALQELGGMDRFISRGDVVVIKPNIGWDRMPEQAANTNPDVVEKLARLCFDAGAKKVVITDVSVNDARRSFSRSGIAKAAREVGAEAPLPDKSSFVDVDIGGEFLGIWPVFKPFIEADKFINVPIAKHHSLPGATLAMKNLYGILGGNRNQLHQRIHDSIADLANFIRPTLTVLDAYRVLIKNGPQGGNPRDVEKRGMIVAGVDQVAIDSYAAQFFFRMIPEEIRWVRIAHDRKLGNMNYRQLSIVERKI
ncbi:MAG: DUF362 domain-containing protein [Fidelibacterota bacterium]